MDGEPLFHLKLQQPLHHEIHDLVGVFDIYDDIKIDPFWILATRGCKLRGWEALGNHAPQLRQCPLDPGIVLTKSVPCSSSLTASGKDHLHKLTRPPKDPLSTRPTYLSGCIVCCLL